MVIRTLDETACRDGRDALIDKVVRPSIERRFQQYPMLNASILMVAQFWDDEAKDGVHGRLLFSSAREPDLMAFRQRVLAEEEDPPFGDESEYYNDLLIEGFPLVVELGSWDESYNWVDWDDNLAAIPLFAAYCEEGVTQDDLVAEWRPYVTFRRDGEGLAAGELAEPCRPWLDGVAGSWSHRLG